jgi:membrane protein required for colicin V production
MQLYDLLMIFVLLTATWWGARKGLAWQVASVMSLLVSYLASLKFSDAIAPFIKAEPPWNRFGAMLVIFLSVSLAVWMVFRMVSNFIDRIKLREFDRQIGALVGLAKGVLLCVVITFFAITLVTNAREPILKSRSGYYIALLIDRADAVMPAEVHDVIGPFLHDLERELDPASPPGNPRPEHPHEHGRDSKTPRTADAEPWQLFKGSSTRQSLRPSGPSQVDSLDQADPLRVLEELVRQGRPRTLQPTTTAQRLKRFQHDWAR